MGVTSGTPEGIDVVLALQLEDSMAVLGELATSIGTIVDWADRIVEAVDAGGKILVFGNGGSAADAQHLVAELVGRFRDPERAPIAAIALTTDSSVLTSLANDFGFEEVFARQVAALAQPGDVVLALSTSGRSPNVRAGLDAARRAGCDTLALLGSGETLPELAASAISVDPTDAGLVQQAHGAAIHLLCEAIEERCRTRRPAATGAVDLAEAVRRRERWQQAGATVVTTNGCFDLLHAGHLASLAEAAAQGDRLVVLVNSDDSVRRLKGAGRPLVASADRAALLAALRMVDLVVVFDDDTPMATLEAPRPDVHCKGADYTLGQIPEAAVVEAGGGRVHLTAIVPGVSTSALTAADGAGA